MFFASAKVPFAPNRTSKVQAGLRHLLHPVICCGAPRLLLAKLTESSSRQVRKQGRTLDVPTNFVPGPGLKADGVSLIYLGTPSFDRITRKL